MQMNTLTNMYEDLSAQERASAMFAALTRSDETEVSSALKEKGIDDCFNN